MNKTIIMGRLTADPELRQTQNGVTSLRFTVAVNRKTADKTTGEKKADFISCQAWRQTAEFINRYFRKGSMIHIEGTLRTGSYQDRIHNDVTHYTTDVLVENVEFCGKSDGEQTPAPVQVQTQPAPQPAQNRPPAPAQPQSSQVYPGFEEIYGDVPW